MQLARSRARPLPAVLAPDPDAPPPNGVEVGIRDAIAPRSARRLDASMMRRRQHEPMGVRVASVGTTGRSVVIVSRTRQVVVGGAVGTGNAVEEAPTGAQGDPPGVGEQGAESASPPLPHTRSKSSSRRSVAIPSATPLKKGSAASC